MPLSGFEPSMSTKLTHFNKHFFSFRNKRASLADVIIMVWATDVSEYPTLTLRALKDVNCCQWPCHVECTSSHLKTEVKQHWVKKVPKLSDHLGTFGAGGIGFAFDAA